MIAAYIVKTLKEQGRSKKWLCETIGINYKTFMRKIKKNSFSATELIKIAKVLDINLNKLKEV